jgi:DNA-binding NarL/FixJ family response regulator
LLPEINIISVLLVNVHSLVRVGVVMMLAAETDMQVIGELNSGE